MLTPPWKQSKNIWHSFPVEPGYEGPVETEYICWGASSPVSSTGHLGVRRADRVWTNSGREECNRWLKFAESVYVSCVSAGSSLVTHCLAQQRGFLAPFHTDWAPRLGSVRPDSATLYATLHVAPCLALQVGLSDPQWHQLGGDRVTRGGQSLVQGLGLAHRSDPEESHGTGPLEGVRNRGVQGWKGINSNPSVIAHDLCIFGRCLSLRDNVQVNSTSSFELTKEFYLQGVVVVMYFSAWALVIKVITVDLVTAFWVRSEGLLGMCVREQESVGDIPL